MEPTLVEVFGANATQTGTSISINKATLQTSTGLTPSADNRAESLVAAILEQASLNLTEANYNLKENQNCYITRNQDILTIRGTSSVIQKSWTVTFVSPAPSQSFNPDDY